MLQVMKVAKTKYCIIYKDMEIIIIFFDILLVKTQTRNSVYAEVFVVVLSRYQVISD